jgi:hypothetical protein
MRLEALIEITTFQQGNSKSSCYNYMCNKKRINELGYLVFTEIAK